MRELWTFGKRHGSEQAAAAVIAAQRSHQTAVSDREAMASVRVEAEQLAEQVRAHNSANRYDDFLRRVMRGDA